MSKSASRLATAMAVLGVTAAAVPTASASNGHGHGHPLPARHVLLLSVDGLHQSDLAWYVARHPQSALARLVGDGTEYTHAKTPVPSDSFPGMVGQLTGGNPRYHRRLLRRHLQHHPPARGDDRLRDGQARGRGRPDGGPRPEQGRRRRRPGPGRTARQRPGHDRRRTVSDRPLEAAGRPHDVRAGLPQQLPAGEHRLRGGPPGPRCGPPGRTSTWRTTSSTGRPAPASRTSSRRRSTARPPATRRPRTGRATTPRRSSTTRTR